MVNLGFPLAGNPAPSWCEDSTIPWPVRRRVGSLFASFAYCNGLVLIPSLTALNDARAFDHQLGSAVPRPERVADLAELAYGNAWRARFGRIWGAFNCLALQGWLELDGQNESTQYCLTALGRRVVTLARAHDETLRLVLEARELLANLHAALRVSPPKRSEVELYAELVRRARAGWALLAAPEVDAACQLRSCLNGMLVCPTLVALGMPVYRNVNELIEVESPALLACSAATGAFNLDEFRDACPGRALLEPMVELLESDGIASRLAKDLWALTPESIERARFLVGGGALVGSYSRTYAQLDVHLFEPSSRLRIDADLHVDRLMNVFGTSRASSEPALEHLCKTYVKQVFDQLPLHEQPFGIADMGCGDGRALRALGEYVLNHTERGRRCREFPLALLGADYNDAPLHRTRAELSYFDTIAGVSTHVVKADMTDPEGYDRTVRALQLRVPARAEPAALRDFLHSFMFIVHNRRLVHSDPQYVHEALVRRLVQPEVRRAASRVLSEEFGITLDSQVSAPAAAWQVAALFPNTYVLDGGAVSGCVVATDLVEFLLRWRPFASHGFLSVEGHVPTGGSLRALPPHPQPHVFRWGIHYISEQYLLSLREYLLATALAGFVPVGRNYGRIYPEGFPLSDDLSSEHCSRSVIHFRQRVDGEL
jgi:hypothetical protein